MACPKCGFEMDPFTVECPRCKSGQPRTPTQQAAAQPSQPRAAQAASVPTAPGQASCPNCGKPMTPGLRFCPPCTTAMRREGSLKREEPRSSGGGGVNSGVVTLVVCLLIAGGLAALWFGKLSPQLQQNRAVKAVRDYTITLTVDHQSKDYTIDDLIHHYNIETQVLEVSLLPIAFKPYKDLGWTAKPAAGGFIVECSFNDRLYRFKTDGKTVEGNNESGKDIMGLEGSMFNTPAPGGFKF